MPGFIYNTTNVVDLTAPGGAHMPVHLHLVVNRRFKDGEGFFLTLGGTGVDGDVRRDSYWLHPSIPIQFFYGDSEPVDVDRSYFEEMLAESRGIFGLHIGETDLFTDTDGTES